MLPEHRETGGTYEQLGRPGDKRRCLSQILHKGLRVAFTIFRCAGAQDRGRMHGCNHGRQVASLLKLATGARNSEAWTHQGLGRSRTQAYDQLGADALHLSLKPGPAGFDLVQARLLVQAQFSARLPFEVFDGVCDVYAPAIDARLYQTLVQELSSRADERPAGSIFLVARLLANHHHIGLWPSDVRSRLQFAENSLCCVSVNLTALAFLDGRTQRGQVPALRNVWGGALCLKRHGRDLSHTFRCGARGLRNVTKPVVSTAGEITPAPGSGIQSAMAHDIGLPIAPSYKSPQPGRDRASVPALRFDAIRFQPTEESVAVEEPLEIQIGFGSRNARQVKPISVTMRTPGNDDELALGFLYGEGVIRDVEQIERVISAIDGAHHVAANRANGCWTSPGVVRIELKPETTLNISSLQRNFYTTSSCGVCGKASLAGLQTVSPPPSPNSFTVPADLLYELQPRLRSAQRNFQQTGGIHSAAIFKDDGTLVRIREDVGRHNAVDKLIGAAMLEDELLLRDRLLLLSGRASFELMQKAVMAGIPMVASVGAPSSLAVTLAKKFDISLIGFLREDHFNVYHGSQRILVREWLPTQCESAAVVADT